MKEITYNVPEDCKEFVEALWGDAQENAELLNIRRYFLRCRELNLDEGTVVWEIAYEVNYGLPCFADELRQLYDAEGPHNYCGAVCMSAAFISSEDRRIAKLISLSYEKRLAAFHDMNYAAYYRRIAEFFPEYTTRYIDAPKGVERDVFYP